MIHPEAALFLDVCIQPDLWPGGAWPLLDEARARNVERLFALAARLGIRQGGIVCAHGASAAEVAGFPPHCEDAPAATARPPGCVPELPMRVWSPDAGRDAPAPAPNRAFATYVASGCRRAPDQGSHGGAFDHLTAGVRDAIVFGAGVEYGIDAAVDALLRRRIRTHVVLDAVGSADETEAQLVLAGWKRRGVDGITAAMLERLLEKPADRVGR